MILYCDEIQKTMEITMTDLFDESKITSAKAGLQSLVGTSDKLRRKEVITKLSMEIREARKRGCSWNEIAEKIHETSGCAISVSTLRTYSRSKAVTRKVKPKAHTCKNTTNAQLNTEIPLDHKPSIQPTTELLQFNFIDVSKKTVFDETF